MGGAAAPEAAHLDLDLGGKLAEGCHGRGWLKLVGNVCSEITRKAGGFGRGGKLSQEPEPSGKVGSTQEDTGAPLGEMEG